MKEDASIENIFGTKNKVKLLKLLVDQEIISFSEIRKHIHLNHTVLKKYLADLKHAGIIREYEINRFKIYSISHKNKRARLIIQLFKQWDTK